MTTYEPVIGLEVHARINTKTKLFCFCKNEAIPDHPNQHICPICMGFPGMLPRYNKQAEERALQASRALQLTINNHVAFDRKSYFYPDLPMGYQITQYYYPLAENGHVEIETSEGTRSIGIERLHVENDAGKLTHYVHGSFVDYNRSGIPLMEIVSRPELYSAEDAVAYARQLQALLRTTGASLADMEKGMMRFDLNISLRPKGSSKLGVKVEVKNLNSFKSLEKAIVFEISRQTKALELGEPISQETRGFNDDSGGTISQRSKEGSADYRYFPEPDIPPLSIPPERIAAITVPELPLQKKKRYMEEYKLEEDVARMLVDDMELGSYFEDLLELVPSPKKAAPWVTSVLKGKLNETKKDIASLRFSQEDLAGIITMVENGTLSHLGGKETFSIMYDTGRSPEDIVKEKGFAQTSDEGELEELVLEIIKKFPTQYAEYTSGKDALIGFFIGQAMSQSKGKANPKIIKEILEKQNQTG